MACVNSYTRRMALFTSGIILPTPDIQLVGFTSKKNRDVYSLLTDASITDYQAIEFVARAEGKSEKLFMMGSRTSTDKLSYIEVVRPHER